MCFISFFVMNIFDKVEHEDEYVRPVLEHCARFKTLHPDLPLFIVG